MGSDGAAAGASSESAVLRSLADAGTHPLVSLLSQGAVFTFDRDLRIVATSGPALSGPAGLPEELRAAEPMMRAVLLGESYTGDVVVGDRVVALRLEPVRDGSGATIGGVGYTQDVTETRRAERALRESERRLRLTVENASIGQAVVELDGRWRTVNAALTRLLGYGEEDLLTMTFQDITHPDDLDLDLDLLAQLVAGEIEDYRMEKRYFTASGGLVWVLLSVALVRDDDGAPLYFVSQIQDITHQKRQHDALQDLTAMLAHDLRTPTTVICAHTALILDDWSATTDDQRRLAFERVGAAARSLSDLLENSLTASALDARGLEPHREDVDLDPAVRAVLAAVPQLPVTVDLSGLEHVAARVDRTHLTQVLTNLLTNAVKYGGDTLTVTTSVTTSVTTTSAGGGAASGHTQVVVSDDGPGVPAAFAGHLFERFTRSPSARSGQHRGSGLGLHIARDLARLNGGDVVHSQTPGGGATFTVVLESADRLVPAGTGSL